MSILQKILRNCLWQILSFLPKDPKKAVCQSFYGRGFSDSPRGIAEELKRRGWKVYWIVDSAEAAASLPEDVTPLLLDSPRAIYHQCTAGAWVDNARKWAYTQKRGRTCYIQTWHGFPLKRIEGDAGDALPPDYIRAAKKDSAMADLFLSDSRFLSEIYRRSFWYQGEILECGFPRNDILFGEHPEITERARRSLGIPKGKKLMLYAPTFRKDKGLEVYDVDYGRVQKALERRFGGEWLLLARLHPNIADKAGELGLDPSVVINASDYPDIQELYLISDALLTDYSSVMFDYMNTGRPCFAYVNDLAAYRSDRNFYFDIDKLPFSRAETNGALEEIILNFDAAAQAQSVKAFCDEFGIIENGSAAKQVADYLTGRNDL